MEALRTKVDSLQWEVNRLDAENRRLRAENPVVSEQVDLEAELEQSRSDVADLTSRLQAYEKQMSEMTATSGDQGEGTRDRELQQTTHELEEAREELRAANEYLVSEKERTAALTTTISDLKTELGGLREECRRYEAGMADLQAEVEREREAIVKDSELKYYRSIEAERAKWEAREQRAVKQLESARRELLSVDKHDVGGEGVVYTTWRDKLCVVEGQLLVANNELDNSKLEIERPLGENESPVLQIEELKAEVALLQAKLRRPHGLGSIPSAGGARITPPMSALAGAPTAGEGLLRVDAPPFAPTSEFTSTSLSPHPLCREMSTSGSVVIPLPPAPAHASIVGAGTTSALPRSPGVMSTLGTTSPGLMSKSGTTTTGSGVSLPGASVTVTDVSSVSCPAAVTSSTSAPCTAATTTVVSTTTSPITSTLGGAVPLLSPGHSPGIFPTSANLLPQIQAYYGGEQKDGETFQDWLEHLEAVSRLARWNDNYKLVYLVTSLRGTAKSFYRSCTATQRSDYGLLIAELTKCFTPVRLPAVQSQMFHDRRQGQKETVDEYAQELRKLYAKAYAAVTRGTAKAEEVGKQVLASQFVTGELQSKVVGLEGSMDQLVMKARFEEAKRKELNPARTTTTQPKKVQSISPTTSTSSTFKPSKQIPRTGSSDTAVSGNTRKCYNCGLNGHMARACPYPNSARRDGEATGRPVSVVSVEGRTDERRQRIQELRRELREAELADAVDEAAPTTHNVSPIGGTSGSILGPAVTVKLGVNGVLTDALVDTGSPATIVSLKFILKVLADSKNSQQTAEEWRKETMKKFSAPAVTLTSCGGDRLNILAQIPVVLSQGELRTDAMVLVQKGAPHSLLLGTDLQARLGFSLIVESGGRRVDLLRDEGENPEDMDQAVESHPPATEPSISMPADLTEAEGDGGHEREVQNQEEATEENTKPEPMGRAVVSHPPSTKHSISTPADMTEGDGSREQEVRNQEKINTPSSVGVVRLLQNVKVPPGYKKIIRAKMEGEISDCLLMCTQCADNPVVMADSVLEGGDGGNVNLIVENHTLEAAHLKKGTILGEITEVEEVKSALHMETSDREVLVEKQDAIVNSGAASVHGLVSELSKDRGTRLLRALNLSIAHLSPTQQQQLVDVLRNHSDTFALESRELGTTSIVTHVIDTGNHAPIRQPVRRTPFALRAKVDELVTDMLEQAVIRPSSSPWASPIVLVRKKDGGTRFCVDYHKLNQITKLDEFPLPRIDDTLDLLAGSHYFTTRT